MTSGIKAFIYPVRNLARTRALYSTLLGVTPNMDWPYYVNFSVDGQDVGLDPNGHNQGMTGPVGYWQVEDIKQICSNSWTLAHVVTDVGGGRLIARVKDADGNDIGMMQAS